LHEDSHELVQAIEYSRQDVLAAAAGFPIEDIATTMNMVATVPPLRAVALLMKAIVLGVWGRRQEVDLKN
jgi:hypothetical protein